MMSLWSKLWWNSVPMLPPMKMSTWGSSLVFARTCRVQCNSKHGGSEFGRRKTKPRHRGWRAMRWLFCRWVIIYPKGFSCGWCMVWESTMTTSCWRKIIPKCMVSHVFINALILWGSLHMEILQIHQTTTFACPSRKPQKSFTRSAGGGGSAWNNLFESITWSWHISNPGKEYNESIYWHTLRIEELPSWKGLYKGHVWPRSVVLEVVADYDM
jgi:hypothetical protein